ncbi:MAG: ubiquitin-like domain-containing protein [Christensenellales bacterium]
MDRQIQDDKEFYIFMFITAMDSKSKKAAYFKRALALILMSLIFITSAFSVAALSRTAVITADGKEMTVTTMSTNTDDILEQAGIDLSLYDEVVRTENENNSIYIVVNRAFPVSLTADGMIQYITMTGGTVADVLEKAGVALDEKVAVTPDAAQEVTPETKIVVSPKIAVSVTADGKTKNGYVAQGVTVEEAIAALGIELSKNDKVSEPLEARAADGMKITIGRVAYKTVTKTEKIAYSVNETKTNDLYEGETKVTKQGVDGKQQLTVKQQLLDGKVVEEKVTAKKVLEKPVAQEVLVGTKKKAVQQSSGAGVPVSASNGVLYDANGNQVSYSNVLYGSGTAYYAPPGALTATGVPAYVGGVAVNPNIIPYGTKMYIVSEDGFVYGYATAIDTGGALMDGSAIVDVYYPTYDDCVVFGRRNVYVYILS